MIALFNAIWAKRFEYFNTRISDLNYAIGPITLGNRKLHAGYKIYSSKLPKS